VCGKVRPERYHFDWARRTNALAGSVHTTHGDSTWTSAPLHVHWFDRLLTNDKGTGEVLRMSCRWLTSLVAGGERKLIATRWQLYS
jgi:hypothetical protein